MIEGRTSRDFHNIKSFCYRDPELFGQLMDLLVEATIVHLSAQAKAGAEALQIFESHAGSARGRVPNMGSRADKTHCKRAQSALA